MNVRAGRGADREVEMALDPRGVVHDGVHPERCVDRAAEPADREQDHRQGRGREQRVAPRQFLQPVEEACRTLHPTRDFERGGHRERRDETRVEDPHRQEGVQQLPRGRHPRVERLVMKPDRRRQHDEQNEDQPRELNSLPP
jgi:hypothetical protein